MSESFLDNVFDFLQKEMLKLEQNTGSKCERIDMSFQLFHKMGCPKSFMGVAVYACPYLNELKVRLYTKKILEEFEESKMRFMKHVNELVL